VTSSLPPSFLGTMQNHSDDGGYRQACRLIHEKVCRSGTQIFIGVGSADYSLGLSGPIGGPIGDSQGIRVLERM
jgi:hypothetical protein